MSDEPTLRLFEPCPIELLPGVVPGAPTEPCTDASCGLRSDHRTDHARLAVPGTVVAIWPAVALTPTRTSAMTELLAASAALVAAAENAETVATRIYGEYAADPVLRRLTERFLRRLPRWDYLPVPVAAVPGREWRELLEEAARAVRTSSTPPREVTQ